MRLRFWIPAFSIAALALTGLCASTIQAGSWFGPSCYGADYAYEYPNRAHNYFGCGPGTSCTARHPLFTHRWLRKNQATSAVAAPVNAAPFEYAPVTAAQTTLPSASIQPASIQPFPGLSRVEPVAQPLPFAPASSSAKPPF